MSIIQFPQRPPMNLETLEEVCLNYLGESKTPIVPVEALLAFCQRTPALAGLTAPVLADFLRSHEQIQVLDGPTEEENITAEMLGQAGIAMGTRAVLKRRVPTQRELYAHMALQLQAMRETLGHALADVSGEAAGGRRAELESALRRVDDLLQRLAGFLR